MSGLIPTRRLVSRRYSGHPPPAAQVAQQVRSSTGATFGPNAHRLPPGWTGGHAYAERHVRRTKGRAS